MGSLAERLAGRFIVLDGPDGSGKSTQLALLHDRLAALGAQVQTDADPGGTDIGEKIRSVLLDRQNGSMSPVCETLLFMASRAQLVQERIRPALKAGKVVLCDRFISATLAYQGAWGVDRKIILQLARIAVGDTWPDLTILLDVPVQVGMRRIGFRRERLKRPGEAPGPPLPFGDRMEERSSAYHQHVRTVFNQLHKYYPRPVAHVCGEGDPEIVLDKILAELEKAFAPQRTRKRRR
jgi:dTMP kinase